MGLGKKGATGERSWRSGKEMRWKEDKGAWTITPSGSFALGDPAERRCFMWP
jgi:hypothetical protein